MANKRAHVISYNDSPLSYGSELSSKRYNQIVDSLKTSVLRAINRSRKTSEKLDLFTKALVAENQYVTSKLNSFSRENPGGNTSLITAYDSPKPNSSSNYKWDKLHGQVVVGYDSSSKYTKVVRTTNIDGERRASLNTFITIDGAAMAHTDSIYNILDGEKNTFWQYEATADQEIQVVIQFPSSIKPLVNYVDLVPFPAYGFEITELLFHKVGGGTENLIPNITGYAMDGLSTHFKPTSWNNQVSFKIKAKQDGIIGISNFDIGLIDYDNSMTTVRYKVDNYYNAAFTHINRINLFDFGLHSIAGSDGDYNPLKEIVVKCYSSDTDTVGTTIPYETLVRGTSDIRGKSTKELSVAKVANKNFYVELSFRKYLGQTPIFRALKITHG